MKSVIAEDVNDSTVDIVGLVVVTVMWLVISFVSVVIAICIQSMWIAVVGVISGTIIACVLQCVFNKRWAKRPY